MTHARMLGVALALGSFTFPSASAQVYERIDVGNQGELGNHSAEFGEISDDGRFVAFGSTATNLGSPVQAIYVRDRLLQTTTVISPPTTGNNFRNPRISRDGSKITYTAGPDLSTAFVHDRVSGVTTEILVPGLVRLSVTGLDRTGDFAALTARSTPTAQEQVYRLHIPTSTVVLCSKLASGALAGGLEGDIDAGGNLVAFTSSGSLVPNDTNGIADVYAYDVAGNVMSRLSVPSGTISPSSGASVDAAGRYVAFISNAANLVLSDTNNRTDVFVRDLQLGTTALVSLNSAQGQLVQGAGFYTNISGDATTVVFSSLEFLAPLDVPANSSVDVFRRDLVAGTLLPVSTGTASGVVMNIRGMGMTFDGREVLFASEQPGMTQLARLTGIFVAEFDSPCSNSTYCTALPNSTGDPATIGVRGTASIALNSFSIGGVDLPSETMAMLVSGTSAIEPGTPFGNGLLCVGGTLVRYGVHAVSGGVFVDDQDLTSAPYSTVQPGEVRNYQIYYRDAAAGGANFNMTDAVSVTFCR